MTIIILGITRHDYGAHKATVQVSYGTLALRIKVFDGANGAWVPGLYRIGEPLKTRIRTAVLAAYAGRAA